MSKVKVPVAGTIGRSVRVNPDATKGATLGVNLYDADGTLLDLEATVEALIPEAEALTSEAPEWGDIAGTLADQTDLQAALDDKINRVSASSANLNSATAAVNTTDKYTGKPVFNSTTNTPVWASGPFATSVWVDATGATAHTPV